MCLGGGFATVQARKASREAALADGGWVRLWRGPDTVPAAVLELGMSWHMLVKQMGRGRA